MSSRTSIAFIIRPIAYGMIISLSTIAWGQANPQVDSPKPEGVKFCLWKGTCSRSLEVVETHRTIEGALDAAQSLKSKGQDVMIVESNQWGHALLVLNYHRRADVDRSRIECTVHERACRRAAGAPAWRVVSPDGKSDLKTVEALLADSARTNRLAVYRVKN